MTPKWVRTSKKPGGWTRRFSSTEKGCISRSYKPQTLDNNFPYLWAIYRDRKEIAHGRDSTLRRAKWAVELAAQKLALLEPESEGA